jgi:hypothetical protein
MSKAKFTGKPVALPGSRHYRSLPTWVLEELDKPAGGKVRRLHDPQKGDALNVHEAAALLEYAPFSMYLLMQGTQGTWRTEGVGVPELGGEVLNVWDEYLLEPGGRLRRLPVCSAGQVGRIKAARTRRKEALQGRAWLTDEDVMRRYPDLFAERAMRELDKTAAEIADRARVTDRDLQRYRPTFLTRWRKPEIGCTYLPGGRHLNHQREAGRIQNDPGDIDAIARAMLAAQERERTNPDSGVVCLPTGVVESERYGISEQELTAYSKRPSTFLPGDGKFHPIYRKNGKSDERWWPLHEVEAFVEGREALQNRVANAKTFIVRLIARAPVRAGAGLKALKDAGFPNWAFRNAVAELKAEGKLTVTRTGSNAWFWHRPKARKPVEKTRKEQARDYLVKLFSRGAASASQVLARARADGYGRWLIYEAFHQLGVHSKLDGKPGTPEQRRLWYREEADLERVQDLGPEPRGREAGSGDHPKKRGPKAKQVVLEVQQFCYVEYRLKGRKRHRVWREARQRFEGRAPKEERHVTIVANRFADAHGHPRHPGPAERTRLLELARQGRLVSCPVDASTP